MDPPCIQPSLLKKLSRPVSHTELDFQPSKSDHNEQLEVIYRLTQLLEGQPSTEAVAFEHVYITLQQGSTFEVAQRPGLHLLQEMLASEAFKTLQNKLRLPETAFFEITSEGNLKTRHSGRTLNLPNAHKLVPEMKEELDVLSEMAGLTGGIISQDEQIGLTHWLKFHHYIVPESVASCRTLVTFLKYDSPKSPPLGNYWEMIKPSDDRVVALSSEQRSQLRRVITSYTRGQSLLNQLSDQAIGGMPLPIRRLDVEGALKQLLSSSITAFWAKAFVRDLGWYGAQDDQPQSDESLQQIILTALLLDLHPMIGEQEPRNHIAGFNLYAADHVEMSFAQVQTAFERYLVEHQRVSEWNAPLASHLLLANAAPEFLVRELPPALLLGTPQWVDFCRTVAVQELNAPGSTRSMTHPQVRQLLQFDAVTESHRSLNALAAVDPVIDWALLNRIVTPEDVDRSLKDSLEKAAAAYTRHSRALAEAAATLTRPLPTRRSIALEILEQVAKGCTYLEKDVLHQKRNRPLVDAYNEFPVSPVDLHMSNDLATGDWDLKTGGSMYATFPAMLPNLISPDGEFYRRFNRDYVAHTQAMSSHLKLALSSVPLAERIRLLKGQLTIFCLRPSVAMLHSITRPPMNPIASTLDVILKVPNRRPMESRKDIEQVMGRYGVVIC